MALPGICLNLWEPESCGICSNLNWIWHSFHEHFRSLKCFPRDARLCEYILTLFKERNRQNTAHESLKTLIWLSSRVRLASRGSQSWIARIVLALFLRCWISGTEWIHSRHVQRGERWVLEHLPLFPLMPKVPFCQGNLFFYFLFFAIKRPFVKACPI